MNRNVFKPSTMLHSSIPYPDGWCEENANTRISRDVFIYKEDAHTGELSFLCKSWKKETHFRVKTAYGNAFGSFVCRPPRNETEATLEAPYIQKEFPRILKPAGQNCYLMVGSTLKAFLRSKQTHLDACLKENRVTQTNPLAELDTFVFQIPSKAQCPTKSNIDAPMTCISKFIQVQDDSVAVTTRRSTQEKKNGSMKGLCWLNEKKAITKANIHGCVIYDFLRHFKMKTSTGLCLRGVFPSTTKIARVLNGSNSVAIYNHIRALHTASQEKYSDITKKYKKSVKHRITNSSYTSVKKKYAHTPTE